ncbi:MULTISPECIES: TetR/AcrR family transcriptional regulator [Vagococcus]|uniref:Transcriptional regulator, TetR family n=1 Tax=Vagococcus fluvialis bH819 TaxID=1255619 RepID=A0A1X6WL22_9ENTE|nr:MULTISPECIES: TetR/AcrR family transcriptional regulator [Vagococcus]SLM84975.1 Transcriptional regulator, TetR family [Vagococcus fluvialis bH819]HCM88608.1 TetR/AcrR family transcriptional regulator [Vagococcus sp.]
MSKKFSESDILVIKENLQIACEESWRIRGYKQTNIPLLTKSVGISSGAFYLIYKRKEDLFLDVLDKIQKQLLTTWSEFIEKDEKKIEGFKKGLQWLFQEYRSYPTLYDLNSDEYALFLAKLPKDKVTELKRKSSDIFKQVIKRSKLILLLPEEEVMDIIHSILFLSLVDGEVLKGTERTFNFLLDHTLYELFKEE